MNLTQMENLATCRNGLPAASALERMDDLFKLRHREAVIISFKLKQLNLFDERFAGTDAESADQRAEVVNQITQAKLRRGRIEQEIIEVAALLVKESA